MVIQILQRNIYFSVLFDVLINHLALFSFAIEHRVGDIVPSGTEEITPLEDVCFEVEGCFPMGKPWRSVQRPLPPPSNPCHIDTSIVLASKITEISVPISPKIKLNAFILKKNRNIFVITHGIAGCRNDPWIIGLKDALLSKGKENIFLVDWSQGAKGCINYLQVASNTRVVGAQVGMLLEHLVQEHNVKPADIHLIGFCLGAHVLAYAAKRIKDVGRLTALDPTAAAFAGPEPRVRVDADDALLVEILHTDARPAAAALVPGVGMRAEYGDVDFYINGGVNQPDCEPPEKIYDIKSLASFEKVTAAQLYDSSKCSHERAAYLYVEVIKSSNCTFWGHPGDLVTPPAIEYSNINEIYNYPSPQYIMPSSETCNLINCVPVGFEAPKFPGRGAYYVLTHQRPPYCVSEPEVDAYMRETLSVSLKMMNKVSIPSNSTRNFTDVETTVSPSVFKNGTTHQLNH